MQRWATLSAPEDNELYYQERLEKLDFPALTYRQFRGPTIKIFKMLHSMYDSNCTNSFFELKESNKREHQFAVKAKLWTTSIRRNFVGLWVANL